MAAIDEDAWQDIVYPQGGQAQIAQTTYGARRLIVRRTRLIGAQAELWPDWRHFCFLTNRTEDIEVVEAEHRDHAVVEQVIADLKAQALAHFPSGDYDANSAWTVLAAIAHNLLRWTQLLGLPQTTTRAAHTLRRRLLSVPGRLTRHARGWTLHLPARWPWQGDYISALNRDPRASRRRLTAGRAPRRQTRLFRPPGRDPRRPTTPRNASAQASKDPSTNDHAPDTDATHRLRGRPTRHSDHQPAGSVDPGLEWFTSRRAAADCQMRRPEIVASQDRVGQEIVGQSRPDISRTAALIPSPPDSTGSTYSLAQASLPPSTPQTITPAMSRRLPSSCVPRQRHSLHSVSASTAVATSSAQKSGTPAKTADQLART